MPNEVHINVSQSSDNTARVGIAQKQNNIGIGFGSGQFPIGGEDYQVITKLEDAVAWQYVDYNHVLNTPYIPDKLSDLREDTFHQSVTEDEKQSWTSKQDEIEDLDEIRSNSQLAATALQKTSSTSIVYGTDEYGNQINYDKDSFSKVNDVKVNGNSVVADKVANIGVPTKLSQLQGDSSHRLTTDHEKNKWDDKVSDILIDGESVVYETVASFHIPSELSELEDDSSHRLVTDEEKAGWSAKADISDIPTTLAELSDDSTHRLVTDTEKYEWNEKADISDIPTALSELSDDSSHRLVTDEEKDAWSAKADISDIPTMLSELEDDSSHRLVTDAEKAEWSGKQDSISDLVTIRSNASAGKSASDTIATYGNIVTHNTSEFYSSTNPNNYQTDTEVADSISTAVSSHNMSEDAHADIRNAMPTKTSDITNDSGFITNSTDELENYTKTEDLSAVALSNDYEDLDNLPTIPSVIDNVSTSDSDNSLSANQGKLLNDRINNLSNIGRFLALWNCVTGLPLSNPSGYPYEYRTGDYFRISSVGEINYIPTGSSYQGVPSTETTTDVVAVGDIYFYDGTVWRLQVNSERLKDVQQNTVSVVDSDGVAKIDAYTQSQANTLLATKANSSDVYSKTEVDELLEDKADVDSPVFTGTPTAPTASTSIANTQIATTAYAKNIAEELIGELPIPMQNKGTVGVGGTYTKETLPEASESNNSWVVRVITADTYYGIETMVGDTLISNGTEWSKFSSNSPSGVLSITAGNGLTGGTITTFGTISHDVSGVTAGTAQGITVNTLGHVTNMVDMNYTNTTVSDTAPDNPKEGDIWIDTSAEVVNSNGGESVWGFITGDIEDQTDLMGVVGDIEDDISTLDERITDTELDIDDIESYIPSDTSATNKLANYANLSNRNLLDNAFFQVNQRGQTSYSGNVYGFDRWKGVNNVKITKNNDGTVSLESIDATYADIRQDIESVSDIAGKTVTFSINVHSFVGNAHVQKLENGVTSPLGDITASGINKFTFSIPSGTTSFAIRIYCNKTELTGSKLTLYSVKLELGSVSTLANDQPLPYSEDLFRCSTSTADSSDTYANMSPSFVNNNAGSHNCVYRGAYLGNAVTQAQWNAISSGTFKDLFIGDYWTIGSVNYRIAAFDYYLNTGDTACNTHHVVIVPDTCLYNHVMNDTNVTTGGYTGSKMYTQGLSSAKTTIKGAFGASHILNHRQYLTTAVTNGYPSVCAWFDSEIELMNENNVYGGMIFNGITAGTDIPALYTIDKTQFPLFVLEPSRITNTHYFWLRDVVSDSAFADVNDTGYMSRFSANNSLGVRPSFCIYQA